MHKWCLLSHCMGATTSDFVFGCSHSFANLFDQLFEQNGRKRVVYLRITHAPEKKRDFVRRLE